MAKYMSYKNRLLQKVKKNKKGCWQWLGATRPNGYGCFQYYGSVIGAHRAAYMLWNGKIKKGMFVCHRCDNPSCVNPRHLWIGTTTDNMRDAKAKGRLCVGPKLHKRSNNAPNKKNLQARIRNRRYYAKKGGYEYKEEKADLACLHAFENRRK